MSSSHYQVYAATMNASRVGDVAADVESIAGAAMNRMPWPDQEAYRGDTDSFAVIVTDHDLLDLEDLPFSSFPYEIEVWNFSSDRVAELDTVRRIGNALEETGRYRTMVTWDAQVRVNPSDPPRAVPWAEA